MIARAVLLAAASAACASPALAIYGQTYLVSGLGTYGGDGNNAPTATFDNPQGLAFDASGNLYIADADNHVVRRISSSGVVSTLAGDGEAGYSEGVGAAARFDTPQGLVADAAGALLYVADTGNHRLRIVPTNGTSPTFALAGDGAAGYAEGVGGAARFQFPRGVAISPDGSTLYVSDTNNNRIRIVPTDGVTATSSLSGSGVSGYVEGAGAAAQWFLPWGLALTSDGSRLYVADRFNHRLRRLPTDGTASSLLCGSGAGYNEGNGAAALLNQPSFAALSSDGSTLYFTDNANQRVRRVVNLAGAGTTSLVAGSGTPGYAEGACASALFNLPAGVALDAAGSLLYVADSGNDRIRTVPVSCAATGATARYAGMGLYEGDGNQSPNATYQLPEAVAVDAATGALYIADTANRVIRVVSPSGVVSTLCGSGASGNAEGCGAGATWVLPSGICVSPSGAELYVADRGGHRVRRVTVSNACTALVAGSSMGYAEGAGPAAQFNAPADVCVNATGTTLYVVDTGNHVVRTVNLSNGATILLAGGPGSAGAADGTLGAARFSSPGGLAVPAAGPADDVYVADTGNHRIRRLNVPGGTVATVAGSSAGYLEGQGTAAQFSAPRRIALSPSGTLLYVADSGNHRVRAVPVSSTTPTSLLAGGGTAGYREGVLATAKMDGPRGLWMEPSGSFVYFADTANHRIRKIELSGPTATATGTATTSATRTQTSTRTPIPTTGSPTASGTPSPTATPAGSDTSTASATGTPTESGTATETASSTASGSGTRTATPTGTWTESGTPSPCGSPTVTQTGSASGTPSGSATATATISRSATESGTGSPTSTPTPSGTLAGTVTPSGTSTACATATASRSASATSTASATVPPSDTATATASPTGSATPTSSATGTLPAPTATATISATVSTSATRTGSATATVSPTATVSRTFTSSATPAATTTYSFTFTPTLSGSPTVLPGAEPGRVILHPNPVPGSRVWLYVWLESPAVVDAYFYAPTGEQKAVAYLGGAGKGWNDLPVELADVAPGVYLVRVVARFTDGSPPRHFPLVKMVVVRR